MLAGKQDAKAALDNAVKRGNEMLRRFEKTRQRVSSVVRDARTRYRADRASLATPLPERRSARASPERLTPRSRA